MLLISDWYVHLYLSSLIDGLLGTLGPHKQLSSSPHRTYIFLFLCSKLMLLPRAMLILFA